jgi:hypothetical protein
VVDEPARGAQRLRRDRGGGAPGGHGRGDDRAARYLLPRSGAPGVGRGRLRAQWRPRTSCFCCSPPAPRAAQGVAHVHGATCGSQPHLPRGLRHTAHGHLYAARRYRLESPGHATASTARFWPGRPPVMYEGHPLYPQADRLWSWCQARGDGALHHGPRSCACSCATAPSIPKSTTSRPAALGTVGEPISPEPGFGSTSTSAAPLPVLDTWWQTETGMVMISPLAISALKPGSVGKPLPGVEATWWMRRQPRAAGQGRFPDHQKAWPAMIREVSGGFGGLGASLGDYWNRFPGVHFRGRGPKGRGRIFLHPGRADEVLSIAGGAMGTAELEAAASVAPGRDRAAVIGLPDRVKGQVPRPSWSRRRATNRSSTGRRGCAGIWPGTCAASSAPS